MRADTVMHVAQDPAAFGRALMITGKLFHARIQQLQFRFLAGDAILHVRNQVTRLRGGLVQARQHDIGQRHAEHQRAVAHPGIATVAIAQSECHQVADADTDVEQHRGSHDLVLQCCETGPDQELGQEHERRDRQRGVQHGQWQGHSGHHGQVAGRQARRQQQRHPVP